MRSFIFTLGILSFCINVFSQNDKALLKKAKQLSLKLTIEEKIAQTCQVTLDAILKTDAKGVIVLPIEIDEKKLNLLILHFNFYLNTIIHIL